jgi:hypothetical protein
MSEDNGDLLTPQGETPGAPVAKKQTPASEMEARMAEVAEQNEMPQELYEKFKGFSGRVEEIKNGGNFDDLKDDIKNELAEGKFPIKQEMLETWITQIHPELNSEDKKDLKEKLLGLTEPLTADEREEPSDPEAAAMEEQKNELLMGADTAAKDEIKAIDASDLDEAQKIELKKHASDTLGRIRGLFLPGEAGRVWSKRLGKGLGYTALAIAIALLAYMKAIHTIARRK